METVSVKILEPKARQILEDIESLNLIELHEPDTIQKPRRRFGSMKGLVEYIAEDFDAPLEELKEYM